MKDMEAQLERLRLDAEDCALISRLATDPNKQELFARLAKHLATLASEVERAIAENRQQGTKLTTALAVVATSSRRNTEEARISL
jgi:hypothetical protein